jgi:hypothetical protein
MAADIAGLVKAIDTDLAALLKDPLYTMLLTADLDYRPLFRWGLQNGLQSTVTPGLKTIQWYDATLMDSRVSLGTAISAAGTTTIDLDPIEQIVVDMVLSWTDTSTGVQELALVTNVDYTAGTATVTRGYAGTAADAVAQYFDVRIMGQMALEGADAGDATAQLGTVRENWGHRMEGVIHVTDEAVMAAIKTRENDPAYMLLQKFHSMTKQCGEAFWSSIKTTGSATTDRRMMDGIRTQIASLGHVDASVGALTFAKLEAPIRVNISNGRVPNAIVLTTTLFDEICTDWAATNKTSSAVDPQTAHNVLTYYHSSASGTKIPIYQDETLLSGEVWIGNTADLGFGGMNVLDSSNADLVSPGVQPAFGSARVERMQRTGPATKLQALAMVTCEARHVAAHSLLTGVSSIDDDGV